MIPATHTQLQDGLETSTGILRQATSKLRCNALRVQVPMASTAHQNYWQRLCVRLWKDSVLGCRDETQMPPEVQKLHEKVQYQIASSDVLMSSIRSEPAYNSSDVSKMANGRRTVTESTKPWSTLLPDYTPSRYSKEAHEFPVEMQRSIEEDSDTVTVVLLITVDKPHSQLELARIG